MSQILTLNSKIISPAIDMIELMYVKNFQFRQIRSLMSSSVPPAEIRPLNLLCRSLSLFGGKFKTLGNVLRPQQAPRRPCKGKGRNRTTRFGMRKS